MDFLKIFLFFVFVPSLLGPIFFLFAHIHNELLDMYLHSLKGSSYEARIAMFPEETPAVVNQKFGILLERIEQKMFPNSKISHVSIALVLPIVSHFATAQFLLRLFLYVFRKSSLARRYFSFIEAWPW